MGPSTGHLQNPVVGRPGDVRVTSVTQVFKIQIRKRKLWQITQDFLVNFSSEKFSEQYSDWKNNLNRDEKWWILEDVIKIWYEGLW